MKKILCLSLLLLFAFTSVGFCATSRISRAPNIMNNDLEMGNTPYSIDGGTNGLAFDPDNDGTNEVTIDGSGVLTATSFVTSGATERITGNTYGEYIDFLTLGDDYIGFYGAGGSNNVSLAFMLDSATAPVISSPSSDSITIAERLSVSNGITPRVTTEASSATPSINVAACDMHTVTALATNITSMTSGLSGTPQSGQKLIVRILDNGTARTIAWGASFASRGVALPTTTVISKYLYVGLIYNSAASTWDCVAVLNEA